MRPTTSFTLSAVCFVFLAWGASLGNARPLSGTWPQKISLASSGHVYVDLTLHSTDFDKSGSGGTQFGHVSAIAHMFDDFKLIFCSLD